MWYTRAPTYVVHKNKLAILDAFRLKVTAAAITSHEKVCWSRGKYTQHFGRHSNMAALRNMRINRETMTDCDIYENIKLTLAVAYEDNLVFNIYYY